MPTKKTSPAKEAPLLLDTLYSEQLRTITEDLRRKAALAAFERLRPSNRVTVEGFLSELKQSKEVWAVVASLGVVDFAEAIVGRRSGRSSVEADGTRAKRTRLSDSQSTVILSGVLDVLGRHKEGLNRKQLAQTLDAAMVERLGMDRADLAQKMRQPLVNLVKESKIHTVGEKRLLKYFAGSGPKKK